MATVIDPAAMARRMLSKAEAALIDMLIAAVSTQAARAAGGLRGSLEGVLTSVTSALAKLPHATANAILEKDRGPSARPLTRDEARMIVDAFGQRVPPHLVRIVPGPGLSYFAKMAFMNGNPAITIGNTIYLKKGSPI